MGADRAAGERGSSELRTVVVEPDPQERARLGDGLPTAVLLERPDEIGPHLHGPAVVVFGPGLADVDTIERTAPLLNGNDSVGGIVVSRTLSTVLLQTALRAGFKDVLVAPVEAGELGEAIDRVTAGLRGLRAPAPDVPPVPAAEHPPGRVVTVFSPKGGVGTSVIAANVAVSLARRERRPVVLVDADLQFGDASVMLKLAPRHTVVDAAAVDTLDPAVLHGMLTLHEPSGLLVLSAPLEPGSADQVGAAHLLRIIQHLRAMAAYVVIDTPAYLDDVVLGIIGESDDVLLVASTDIPTVKNVRMGLQTLRLLDTPVHKIRLVLNRANAKVKLDPADVERTLQTKADVRVPSDVSVPQSVNKGEPVVLDAPRSGPAKAIEALVEQLVATPAR